MEVNIKEEELLFKLKDGIGIRSNDYILAMNKFREEIEVPEKYISGTV